MQILKLLLQSPWFPMILAQQIMWACSPGVLNPFGSFNPSFPSSVTFPILHLVFGFYLLPYAVGRSLSDSNWTRSQMYEYRRISWISLGIIYLRAFFFFCRFCFVILYISRPSSFWFWAIQALLGMSSHSYLGPQVWLVTRCPFSQVLDHHFQNTAYRKDMWRG